MAELMSKKDGPFHSAKAGIGLGTLSAQKRLGAALQRALSPVKRHGVNLMLFGHADSVSAKLSFLEELKLLFRSKSFGPSVYGNQLSWAVEEEQYVNAGNETS